MTNTEKEYYYAGEKKIKLNRVHDSFFVRYKKDITSRAIERKLAEKADFADAEERKQMPEYNAIMVTLPPYRRTADVEESVKSLEADSDIESIAQVYREAQSGLRLIATDEITVRFKSNVSQSQIEKFNKENNVEIIEQNQYVPNQYLLRGKNPKDTLTLANKYQKSDLTEFAEPNFISEVKKEALTNDTFINEQWHLDNTGQEGGSEGEDVSASEAWETTKGSSDIVIAILDDGVDIDHPDLKENIWKNPNSNEPDIHGWNFFDNNSDPRPRKFTPPYNKTTGNDIHGTPCAGVAAAMGNNNIGVAGIAYNCKILPVKIFLGDDLVPVNILADAIRYAGQKADVLSNSWSCSPSSDVEQAIKDVVQTGRGGKGTPVFVATGNGYNDFVSFPARVPEAIAVGASTNLGKRAEYSNYGRRLDFLAPSSGGTKNIFTTDVSIPNRGYNLGDTDQGDADGLYTNSFGGTSSATPLAAGVAALMLSSKPELKWDRVRNYMRDSADKINQVNANYVNGFSEQYGYGRINTHKALKKIEPNDQNGDVISKQITPALSIPDHNMEGIISSINIDKNGTIASIEEVSVDISHSYRGDLLVLLITPENEIINLHEGEGGGADNLKEVYNHGNTTALQQLIGKGVRGEWLLKVIDRWPKDTGTLNSWGLKIRLKKNVLVESISPGVHIPDNNPKGIISTMDFSTHGQIKDIKVTVDISHTYIGDLTVTLTSPSLKTITLHNGTGGSSENIQTEYRMTSHPQLDNLMGEDINGTWKLAVADLCGMDVGKLNRWEIEAMV